MQRPLVTVDTISVRDGSKGATLIDGVYRETRRSSYCREHGRISSDYVGVNSKGLIFRCEGWTEAQAKSYKLKNHGMGHIAGVWHYFVAEMES